MRIASSLVCLSVIALAGCSPPKPPEEQRRPEPQAAGVVQAADAYKDAARAAVAKTEDAAAKEKAALDAATQ